MPDIILSIDDDGGKFTISLSDRLIVNLEHLGGAGFEWDYDEEKDKIDGIFFLDKSPSDSSLNSGAVGGSGLKTFIFQPIKKGTTPLRLKHWRKWDPNSPPIKEFGVTIRIA